MQKKKKKTFQIVVIFCAEVMEISTIDFVRNEITCNMIIMIWCLIFFHNHNDNFEIRDVNHHYKC